MSADIFWSIHIEEPPKARLHSYNGSHWLKLNCDNDGVIVQVRSEQLERAKAAAEAFNAIFAKAEVTPATDEAA